MCETNGESRANGSVPGATYHTKPAPPMPIMMGACVTLSATERASQEAVLQPWRESQRARQEERAAAERAKQEAWEAAQQVEAERMQSWHEAHERRLDIALLNERKRLNLEEAKAYSALGESRRAAWRLRRQEQHCELCGHRFNYNKDGSLKPEHEWCPVNQTKCNKSSAKDNANPDCLRFQEAQRKAQERAAKPRKAPERVAP